MKKKKINLNYYEVVESEEEATLIIMPFQKDGVDLPPMYFKSKKNPNLVDGTENVTWSSHCNISISGTMEDYAKRVDWWFDSMTDEYKSVLVAMAKKAIGDGWDISMSINKAKKWLKDRSPSNRKSHLSKFLSNWVSIGVNKFLNSHGRIFI